MNSLKLSLVCAAFAATVAAIFIAGQAVEARTHRLFAAYDQHREAMIARNCGHHASLWRNTATGEYGCMHINRDGRALLAPASDSYALTAQR